nr:MAG TPA: hypothetical protein [Caudoviricetes sp.]
MIFTIRVRACKSFLCKYIDFVILRKNLLTTFENIK